MTNSNIITIGQLTINYLKDGSADGETGMFELTVLPGAKVPPQHSHSLNEEIIYVVEGKLRYTVGTETRDLAVGESMTTPKGTVHGFSNPFEGKAKALVVLSPDVGAQYFKDVAELIGAGGPPNILAIEEVMNKYGLKLPAKS